MQGSKTIINKLYQGKIKVPFRKEFNKRSKWMNIANLKFAAVKASTAAFVSRMEAMWMLWSLGQLLPRPSTMRVRSVVSFSCREKSREISFKLGQLKTYRGEHTSRICLQPRISTITSYAIYHLRVTIEIWKPKSGETGWTKSKTPKIRAAFHLEISKTSFVSNKTTQLIPALDGMAFIKYIENAICIPLATIYCMNLYYRILE